MRWVERQDVGHPGPQSRHCMAYDRDLGLTLLFTSDLAAGFGYLWDELGQTVRHRAASGWDRLDAALAYDPVRRVVLLAGGFGRAANAPLADTWTFTRTGPTEGRWTRQADLLGASYSVGTQMVEAAGRFNSNT